MPYLQPKTANYFGLMPAVAQGTIVRVTPYNVSSSEANAINAGDVVTYTTDLATARVVTGAFAGVVLGVAANSIAANAGSTAATIRSNSSQLLYVYDDPDQVFVASVSSSGLAGSTSVGKNVAILSTGVVGSTGANSSLLRSVMAISGATASSAGSFRLIGLHPIEVGDYSTAAGSAAGAAADVRKWLIKAAAHYHGIGSTATTVVTT